MMLGATLDCGVKLKGLGVVSAAMVVTVNVDATPPTVTVTELLVPNTADDRTWTFKL